MPGRGSTIPLLSRRRLTGVPFGYMRSRRRGLGLDLVGARPHRPGDDVRAIDHRATARLSSARGHDELVVREFLTEEAARVVLVVDRRPSMALSAADSPWLSKPAAVATVARLLVESAREARCPIGVLEAGTEAESRWAAPDGRGEAAEVIACSGSAARFNAPEDCLERAIDRLVGLDRALPPGTFVFLLSDFLSLSRADVWSRPLARRWDLVPVVVQDPVWERSFPHIAGTALAIADPSTSEVRRVWITAAEAVRRRRANERRLRELLELFRALDVSPVLISAAEHDAVLRELSSWAEGRREGARLIR